MFITISLINSPNKEIYFEFDYAIGNNNNDDNVLSMEIIKIIIVRLTRHGFVLNCVKNKPEASMGKNMRIRGIDENCDRHVNKVVKR